MGLFPEIIKISIVDSSTRCSVQGIAVMLHLFANHKNDYNLIPEISNKSGEIIINKEWIKKEIETSRKLFIMDYGSTINDCKPCVQIKIMDIDSIRRAIESMTAWRTILKTPQDVIENLRMARNTLYKPLSKILYFNGSDVASIVIEVQKI